MKSGGLDWLADEDKIGLDVSGHPTLAKAKRLLDPQIAGKNYSDAVIGRRCHLQATNLTP